jgi:hypothetical protein
MKELGLFLCIILIPATTVFSDDDSSAKKSKPPFTISKETTYLTEPLTEDGYVDYVAAINKRCSEGVTAENNAAVLLLEAIGPKTIKEEMRERYYQMLGVKAFPEQGDYFVPFWDFYEAKRPATGNRPPTQEDNTETQKACDLFYKTMEKPWTAEKHPLYAEWLKANRKPLEKIIAGTKRQKYYAPMIVEKVENYAPLISAAPIEMVQNARQCAYLLSYHAMYSIGEGKLEDAKQDLLACHRLARLVSQGPMLIDELVGVALEGMACQGDLILARSGKLSSADALAYMQELKKLPQLSGLTEKIDKYERIVVLDCTQMLTKNGSKTLFLLLDGKVGKDDNPYREYFYESLSSTLVWDEVMQSLNGRYDRIAKIQRKRTYAERANEWKKLESELRQLSQDARSLKNVGDALLAGKPLRTIVSNKFGNIVAEFFIPALQVSIQTEERHMMHFEMAQIALALTAYRADTGSYPKKLADLKPKYLAEIPKDRFSDADLIYRHDGAGYILYSVGYNGKDDGGMSKFNDPPDEDGDDLVVRTPKETK